VAASASGLLAWAGADSPRGLRRPASVFPAKHPRQTRGHSPASLPTSNLADLPMGAGVSSEKGVLLNPEAPAIKRLLDQRRRSYVVLPRILGAAAFRASISASAHVSAQFLAGLCSFGCLARRRQVWPWPGGSRIRQSARPSLCSSYCSTVCRGLYRECILQLRQHKLSMEPTLQVRVAALHALMPRP